LQRRKKRIVEAYLYENTLDKETYRRRLGRVEQDLTLVELYPYAAKVDEFDIERTVAFAEHLSGLRVGAHWHDGQPALS
jgi:hypothetical protein